MTSPRRTTTIMIRLRNAFYNVLLNYMYLVWIDLNIIELNSMHIYHNLTCAYAYQIDLSSNLISDILGFFFS